MAELLQAARGKAPSMELLTSDRSPARAAVVHLLQGPAALPGVKQGQSWDGTSGLQLFAHLGQGERIINSLPMIKRAEKCFSSQQNESTWSASDLFCSWVLPPLLAQ